MSEMFATSRLTGGIRRGWRVGDQNRLTFPSVCEWQMPKVPSAAPQAADRHVRTSIMVAMIETALASCVALLLATPPAGLT
jgi:hypothetical protein